MDASEMKNISTKRIFGLSLLFTTLVFIAGLFAGYGLDSLRSHTVYDDLQQNELDAQSFTIEQEFLDKISNYDCSLATPRLSTMSKELGKLGYYLLNYEKTSIFKRSEYDYLIRKYYLQQVRTYTLYEQLNEKCNLDSDLILFFFDPEDSTSTTQGNVLDVMVEKNPNISVFSINAKYEGDPTLITLKQYYNITETPTIVINDKVKKSGLVGEDELLELMK